MRWSKESRSFYVENLFTVDCEQLDDLFAVLEEGMFCYVVYSIWQVIILCNSRGVVIVIIFCHLVIVHYYFNNLNSK